MRAFEFITEARNYADMFSKMLRLAVPDEKERTTLTNRYAVTAENARKILKRSDRIIWYIQQVKISTMTQYGTGVPEQNLAAFRAELDKLLSKYDHDPKVIPNGLIYNLEHFLSLPVPEIQSYQFTNQSVNQVLSDFEQLETEWKEQTVGLIKPEPGDRILIDLGDSAWWLLNRGACSKEGEAMGHCGNVPSERPGDRILSYRTRRTEDDWTVNLTFILNEHGILGEMKGRGNEKPAPKYHKAIVELLKHDIIKGIQGGGYLPEHNFDMMDLPESTRKSLYKIKPELMPLADKFKHFGIDHESSRTQLLARLDSMGYSPTTIDDKPAIRIDEYHSSDLNRMVTDYNLPNLGKLLHSLSILRFESSFVDKPDDTYLLNHVFRNIRPTPDIVKYLKYHTNATITHGSDILNTIQKLRKFDRANASERDLDAIIAMRKLYNHIESCIDDDLKTNTTDAVMELLQTISETNPVKFHIAGDDEAYQNISEYVLLDDIITNMMQGRTDFSDLMNIIGHEAFDLERFDIEEDADLTEYLNPENVQNCMREYLRELSKPIELSWPDTDE